MVETDRVEYKSGWNPEDIIHTMCAFANDIHNLGGGFIVLGVEEKEGLPQLPPKGLQRNQIDAIQNKLLELSNMIHPAYFGISTVSEISEIPILVLQCPGGDHRPYSAPVSLSRKSKDRAYWIRRYSSTVRANSNERQTLHEMAAKVPFDDRICHQASLTDLSLSLVKEFLKKVESPLFEQADTISFQDLCRQMQIVKGSEEQIKPVNVGLLLFNENPERFFPVTQIEVVIYRDEVGDRFSERAPTYRRTCNRFPQNI
ncbi:MAG: ATP-binding protein [Balneolaceae bacterium]|nr:ATP-binding protein [Balneolaceae bacterium]